MTIREIEDLPPYEQQFALMAWFQEFYYDPDTEGQYGDRRRYRWPPGDVVDPLTELEYAFENQRVSRQAKQSAADQLTEISTNWRSRPDEFEDGAEVEIRGRAFAAGDRSGQRLWHDFVEVRDDLLSKLDELAKRIDAIECPSAAFGHNNPPEPLADLPASKADIAELKASVLALKDEVVAEKPSSETLERQSGKLIEFTKKILAWSGERGTKLADAALTSAAKVAGPVVALDIFDLLPSIYQVTAATQQFLAMLKPLF